MKKIHLTQSDLELIRLRDTMRPELERGMSVGQELPRDEIKREQVCRISWRKEARLARTGKAKPKKKIPPRNPMLPGEIPIKEYTAALAKAEGVSLSAIQNRLWTTNYAGVPIRRINKRVIFVKTQPQTE